MNALLSILLPLASAVGAVAGVVGAVIACFRSPRPTKEELERWDQRSLSWPGDAGDVMVGANGVSLTAVDNRSLSDWEVEAQSALGED